MVGIARKFHTQQTHYLRRTITEADEGVGALVVGTAPAGALYLNAGIIVTTAFNGTSPIAQIGPSGDPDGWGTNLALGTIGRVPGDEFATTNDLLAAADEDIHVTVSATGNDSTAGSAVVFVEFIPNNDL